MLTEVQDLVNTLQAMYRDKNIQARIDIPSGANTNMDREDLHEMLGNILDNAWKWASQHCQVSVKQANNSLVFIVQDDGPGCEPLAMEEIVQRGVRLDESKQGHGLGLSIVKDIVAQYQGSLDISHSELLGGLKITINLPL